MSVQNILIDGTALFQDNTENAGVVDTGLFDGSAVNTGTTTVASFSGTAANHGTVVTEASFTDSAINTGTVAIAAFTGSASNAGTVTEEATFADTTTNSGVVSGTATFSDSAENDGGTVAGPAVFADTAVNTGSVAGPVVFSGTAVNNGTVAEAIFLGSAQNGGIVTGAATFAENAGNLGTGLIQGDAVFADNTVNAGTVQGNAEVAATANGEQGTVQGSVSEYVQPNGAFAYGYFSGGSKTAPASYATVVYQVGSFWYKYDASGNGALATGNYSDGTSMFTFAKGVKGAAYTPQPAGNWYDDTSSLSHVINLVGGVTQSDQGGGVRVAAFNGSTGYISTDAVGSEFDLSSGDSTIECWVYPTAATYGAIVYGTGTGAFVIHMYDDGNIHVNDGASGDVTFPATLNEWQHVAVVFSNTQKYVYRNGILQTTSSQAFGSTNTVAVGNLPSQGRFFSGSIAGLRIVKGTALYNNNFSPTTVPSNVSGTSLLLNFNASAVPAYVPHADGWDSTAQLYYLKGNATTLDANGETTWNTSDGSYTPWNGLFYSGGVPYNGAAMFGQDEYGNWLNQADFVNGVEVYRGPAH